MATRGWTPDLGFKAAAGVIGSLVGAAGVMVALRREPARAEVAPVPRALSVFLVMVVDRYFCPP